MSRATTMEKIRPMVREIVEETLLELLGDPDSGLEVRESVKKKLLSSLSAKRAAIPAKDVAKRAGLKW